MKMESLEQENVGFLTERTNSEKKTGRLLSFREKTEQLRIRHAKWFLRKNRHHLNQSYFEIIWGTYHFFFKKIVM